MLTVMEVCTIDLHANAFMGDEFETIWAPAAAKVMDFGAKGYSFIREQEDPLHFIQYSYWGDRLEFERYWFSDEMTDHRQKAIGTHGVPILPRWSTIVDRR